MNWTDFYSMSNSTLGDTLNGGLSIQDKVISVNIDLNHKEVSKFEWLSVPISNANIEMRYRGDKTNN